MEGRSKLPPTGTTLDGGRLLSGLTLIVVGALFWLDEVDRLEIENLWEFWPLALIAHGLGKIFRRDACSRSGGWTVLTLGVLFLLDVTLDLVTFDQTWPLLLLVAGVGMVWQAFRDSQPVSTREGGL